MTTKLASLAATFLAIATAARVAAAQPGAGPPAPPSPPDEPTPPTPPTPPEPPQPPPAPVAVESSASTHRPDGFSIAIGLGWDLPTSIEQPDVTSVRFRLASGLTFEPIVTIGGSSSSTDDGNGNTMTSKTGDFALSTVVRVPRRVHDRVDLVLVGAAGLGVHTDDPQGDNNNTSKTDLFLAWGLGLEYWIGAHWSVSLTATNPLIESQRQTMQQIVGKDTTSSTTTFGLIWDPNVVLMTHLYL